MPSEPMVRLRQLRYSGDKRLVALHGLTLDIAPGAIVALLGPRGAGKTTALRLLAGFVRAEAGEMRVDGRLLDRTPPGRRGIGTVFDGADLLQNRNIGRNLAVPLHGLGFAEIESRVAALLRRFGLAGLGPLLPQRLTLVQQHRAALACAVAGRPKLLLLDDPWAGLDPDERGDMQDLLRSLAGEMTILHATTDPQEALAVADSIAVLDAGRLLQHGAAQAVYDAPTSLRTASLLGPLNTLAGAVEAIEDDLAVIRLDCGPRVEALAVDVAAGDRCIMAVRPERVAVAAVSAEEMGDGALPARILVIRPGGDHSRLRLIVGDGGTAAAMVVRRPAGVPLTGLAPGRQAAIAWQPYQARAFRAEPG